ncbi:MAG: cysteine desulfurase family protein [Proteobacteria bacterium]|nr:cysteine desulfurase family protein [Pseudomonadota bacterium]
MTERLYFDHNATAPLRPEAAAAARDALALCGNPSSVHAAGREARRVVEDARERVAALVGADPANVILTSGGTEANNLALRGPSVARILVGATEHESVLGAVDGADRVPVDGNGVTRLDALERMLAAGEGPTLVSVMHGNNETGAIQPIAEIADLCRRHGALLHCDAVQSAGKIALSIGSLGADMISLSSHKLGGPTGAGALVLAGDLELVATARGGGQERRRRGGTENVIGIAGFGAAAEAAGRDLPDEAGLAALRDEMEAAIRAIDPAVRIFGAGAGAERLPNTSCLAMAGIAAETQVMAFDLEGICVSAGAACSSGKIQASHVLGAMGVDAAEARTAIRISLGRDSDSAQVQRFVAAWGRLYERRQNMASAA